MTDLPAWAADYIGLPFREKGRDRDGVDCWGLVRLVLAEQFGLKVPSYSEDYDEARPGPALADLIEREARAWVKVLGGSERAGDVVVLRVNGRPFHVGMVLARPWMMHVEAGLGAVRERYDGRAWGRRVLGFYRWAGSS